MTDDYIGPPVTDDEEEGNADAVPVDVDTNGRDVDEDVDEEDEDEEAVMDLIEEEVLDENGNPDPSATPTKQSNKSKSSAKTPKTPKRRKGRAAEHDDAAHGEDKMTVDSTPLKRKKKKKARKSEQVNLHAVSQEQVLVAEMEGTQMVHLKLRKRYYAEALDFIRWLEQGSETLAELLGSTHKTEVLEAMEFFRVSYEYGIESAQVGISCS
jgi:condensin complex subunit 1